MVVVIIVFAIAMLIITNLVAYKIKEKYFPDMIYETYAVLGVNIVSISLIFAYVYKVMK
jgi:hypothetical protein